LFAAVALVALRYCLPGPDTEPAADGDGGADRRSTDRPAAGPRTAYVLAALVVIATAGTLVEDAGNSWAALYLSDWLGGSAALAGSGYMALVGGRFVGGLVGDRLVAGLGQ